MSNTPQTEQFWQSTGVLLVCVGSSPSSARVVRAAKRMADAFGCPWIAVHVEHPHESKDNQRRSADILKHAEKLGAEVVTIAGDDIAESIIEYARLRGVNKIMVGKTGKGLISQLIHASLVDKLLRLSGDIDVLVVRGEGESLSHKTPHAKLLRFRLNHISGTVLILTVCMSVSALFKWYGLADANIVMVFLSGVVLIAGRYGRWIGVVASLGSVVLFDILFVEPYFTLSVHDTQYFIMFAVMLVITLFVSDLTARIRRQADIAECHERRTEILYSLSRHLATSSGVNSLVSVVQTQLSVIFDADVSVLLPDNNGGLSSSYIETKFIQNNNEWEAARWAIRHNHPAGYGTDTGHNISGLFIPLGTADKVLAVLGIRLKDNSELSLERKQMLESCVTQISVALEREHLAEESQKALLQIEAERWRNALLSSISHDLRTPLAGIAGTASALITIENKHEKPERLQLLENISIEANRLSRLVENLLSLVRIESDRAVLKKEWLPLEEVVGSSLQALRHQIADRRISTHLPENLPLVFIDGVLIEQAIINLLDNAAKYTPQEKGITINANIEGENVVLEVQDEGMGITPEEMPHLFDKFFRGGRKPSGSGLGLTITKAIVEAHNGCIVAENITNGGACFRITLPIGGQPPLLDVTDFETIS
ncbi:MAG: sensor histidine kinase KdpD [Candidatus Latescibacteria bacterium]|nr:sensor histidine kinase KdpD [Candidatus Latescibacterota bacterium]